MFRLEDGGKRRWLGHPVQKPNTPFRSLAPRSEVDLLSTNGLWEAGALGPGLAAKEPQLELPSFHCGTKIWLS